MTTWTSDELNKIGRAEELQIASLQRDSTLRNPVTIWVVRLGDDLQVRSVYGRTSAWFRCAQVRHEGRIRPAINEQIDAAYRRYTASIINTIVSPAARSATIKLVPRPAGASFKN